MEGPGNGPLRRGTTLLHGARIAATVVVVVGSQCMELPAGMNATAFTECRLTLALRAPA